MSSAVSGVLSQPVVNNKAASVLLSSEAFTTELELKNDINNLKLNKDEFHKDKNTQR
ncbi:hypothetical protein GCM10016272_08450 [Psychrobacter glaciei]|uniref:Uncharacterized protein n=1 Tax=Psychrobacter glaciei TaxID=619771 RepID=A0ABQ3GNL0_9GAMM|nr:hypothetical protein GCM10016272_08450 [Psychrobacter glaciei]